MSTQLCDVDAEQRLLGGLLEGGDVIAVAEIVQATDFYLERNQYIYTAVNHVLNAAVRISPATVAAELRRTGHGEVSEAALDGLRDQAIFAYADVESHAKTVREHAQNRKLKTALESAARMVHDPKLTPEQKLDAAQHAVMDLANHQAAPELADGAQLAKAAGERWKRRREAPDGLMGLPWGLPDLDKMTGGLQGGMLYIVGARTSMGKTWLGIASASHVSLRLNRPTLFISLEMGRESIGERIAACEAGLRTSELTEPTDIQAQRYNTALEKLEASPLFVDDSSTTPLAGISARARKLHRSAPLGLIVVDYLQLIDTTDTEISATRATQVGNLSRGLKKLARELNVPIIVLAQLSRAVESRPNKRPILSDLKESGGIEQDADVVLLLYREEYYDSKTLKTNVVEINIAKQREGEVGTVEVSFNPATGRFGQLSRATEGGRP